MPHMQLNEAHYYYERHGQGEPIVLIAGYSCDYTFWDGVTRELIKHFEVINFDNRAVGQTKDNGSAITLEMMANETVELIQALNIRYATIVGHSMGGIIAQMIAKKNPGLVNRLVVLNSAPSISIRSLMALESFIRLIKEEAPIETVIEASMPWFFSSHFLANRKNIQMFKDRIMGNPHPQSLTDLERQYNALKQFDVTKWQQTIAAPTLVLSSKDDIITPPSEGELVLKSAPQAKVSVISGGHSSPLETPIEVAHTIIPFLLK